MKTPKQRGFSTAKPPAKEGTGPLAPRPFADPRSVEPLEEPLTRADDSASEPHGLGGFATGPVWAAPVQRLAQYKFPAYQAVGLNSRPAKQKTINIGRGEGDVGLFEVSVGKKADRVAALIAMAAKAGQVGAVQKAIGKNWVTNPYYLDRSPANKLTWNTDHVDPFVLRLKAEYGDTDKMLALDFQMANTWPGYVIRVEDDGVAANMVDDPRPYKDELDRDPIPEYSNVHKTDVGTPLVGTLGDRGDTTKTMRDQEASFDAFTKLAGEGARFMAVRNHASKIQDDSWLMTVDDDTKDDPDPKYWGLTFRVLWKCWKDRPFFKQFNISDQQLKDAINRFEVPYWQRKESQLSSKDYNLDTSQAFDD